MTDAAFEVAAACASRGIRAAMRHARCREDGHGVWDDCHLRVSRRLGGRPRLHSNAWRTCVRVGRRPRARLAVFASRRSVATRVAAGMVAACGVLVTRHATAVRVEAGSRRAALAQTLPFSPEDGNQRQTRWLVLAVRLIMGHGLAADRGSWLVMGRGWAAGRGRVSSSSPGSLSWPGERVDNDCGRVGASVASQLRRRARQLQDGSGRSNATVNFR